MYVEIMIVFKTQVVKVFEKGSGETFFQKVSPENYLSD